MQMRFRRAGGEYRWQLVHRVPLRDENGNVIRWYGVGSDIEDQKRAENALRKSEAYLDQAQQLSHTGSLAGMSPAATSPGRGRPIRYWGSTAPWRRPST